MVENFPDRAWEYFLLEQNCLLERKKYNINTSSLTKKIKKLSLKSQIRSLRSIINQLEA